MEMPEKIFWFILGMAVGSILGYIVRSLREIKEELDEVHQDQIAKNNQRDERGAAVPAFVGNIALFLVVLMTAYAAFASQSASNKVQDQQDRNSATVSCTQTYLDKTIVALNERTTFSTGQAEANADLQRAQKRYFTLLLTVPPLTDPELRDALMDYFEALNRYLELVRATADKTEMYAYPTAQELNACLHPDED